MEEKGLSKKEKRLLVKEQKKVNAMASERDKKIKKAIVGILILAGVIYLGYNSKKTGGQDSSSQSEVLQVNERDWVRGERQAKVTLIEYGDFQCPACADYAPIVKKLGEEFSQDLAIVYRHFPLVTIHDNAFAAALASEAAGKESKFWEMHDILYEKQEEWVKERDPKGKFAEYAESIGIDKDKFLAGFESTDIKKKVEEDNLSASRLRLNSTPTYFLNGEKIQPRGYEEFKEKIESFLRGYNLQ